MNNNIFIKKKDINLNKVQSKKEYKESIEDKIEGGKEKIKEERIDIYKLNLKEVKGSIPENSQKKPNKSLSNIMREYRWRFLKVNDKIFTEISYKDPNNERLYKDKYGEWKYSEISKDYDNNIIDEYYYYEE